MLLRVFVKMGCAGGFISATVVDEEVVVDYHTRTSLFIRIDVCTFLYWILQSAPEVLSAHVLPKKFPVDPDRMIYPPAKELNPLYATTNTTYGQEVPRPHQVADAFFPRTNKFTKTYTDSKPRVCGLNCARDKPTFKDEI